MYLKNLGIPHKLSSSRITLSTGQKVAKVGRKEFYKDNHIKNKTPSKRLTYSEKCCSNI